MGWDKDKRPLLRPGDREMPIKTESTVTALQNYGNSIVKSTATNRKYNLNAPVAGVVKTIFATQCTTSLIAQVVMTNATIYPAVGSGSTIHSVKFNHPNQSITLMGLSTNRWGVLGSNNSPVMSTAV